MTTMQRSAKLVLYLICFLLIITFLLKGCSKPHNPIEDIEASLKSAPTYSIVLEDMREEGNFFKDYYHKYKIVQAENAHTTDWLKVPEAVYQSYLPLLGMVIAGKTQGKDLTEPAPPGYQYVGNPRYGSWQTNSTGHSVWIFTPGLPMWRGLDVGTYPPIYRSDYDAYRKAGSLNKPYFGQNHQFGTTGSWTQKHKPSFFQRRMATEAVKKASFTEKVGKRIGRTKTGFRGRSGSGGK